MSARVTPPGLSNERPRYLEATHDCDPRRSKGSAVVRVGRSLSRATSARVWKKALQRRSAQRFLFKLRTTLTHIKSKRGEPNIDQTLPVWGGRPRPPPCECTAQTLAPRPGGVDIRRRRSATVRQISPCVRSIGKIFTHTRNSREAAPFRPKLPKPPQAMLQNFRSLTRCKRKNEQPCANSV